MCCALLLGPFPLSSLFLLLIRVLLHLLLFPLSFYSFLSFARQTLISFRTSFFFFSSSQRFLSPFNFLLSSFLCRLNLFSFFPFPFQIAILILQIAHFLHRFLHFSRGSDNAKFLVLCWKKSSFECDKDRLFWLLPHTFHTRNGHRNRRMADDRLRRRTQDRSMSNR